MNFVHRLSSAMEHALGLGLESRDLSGWQMSLRALIVFLVATIMIRIGSRRFIGRSTALDVLLGIIFGSVISRAITGTSPFFPTLGAALTLVLIHWLLCAFAFHSHRFGNLVKGHPMLLVERGEIHWKAMARGHITEHDLQEALRSHGLPPEISEIETAHLERNGDISIVTRHRIPAGSIKPPST